MALVTDIRALPSQTGMRVGTARQREIVTGYVMLLPVIIAVLLLRVWPVLVAVENSIVSPGKPGVDFSLYAELFGDPTFLKSLLVTGIYSIIVNPVQIVAALLLALLFNERIPTGNVWRSLIVLPVVIPQSISALIWGTALRPDGPVNAVLGSFGIAPQGWLITTQWALPSIIVVVSWVGVGYWMTFLIAGLKDIPMGLYEAAVIDGASAWRRFWSVTLPLLRRPLLFVLVADTVANFLTFAPAQILTNGGPRQTTNFLMMEVYTRTFKYGDYAGGAAETVIVVAVVLVVVMIQFRLLRGGAS